MKWGGCGRRKDTKCLPHPQRCLYLNSWNMRLYYIKVADVIEVVNHLFLKQGYWLSSWITVVGPQGPVEQKRETKERDQREGIVSSPGTNVADVKAVSGSWKRLIVPWSFQKECRLADTLILAHETHLRFLTSGTMR